jgi:vaccinia related kinase
MLTYELACVNATYPNLQNLQEPHTNGPLFVERNFYLRAAKPEMLSTYKEQKNLTHLGVPRFVASGSFMYK